MENAKLLLDRVDIEGFRGVNRGISVKFDPSSTVLSAPNGRGKTTILGAIEWCLFGELAYQIKENTTNDEVVNLHHPSGEASVRLHLRRGDEVLIIERRRRLGRRESATRILGPTGDDVDTDDADGYLFRLMGLTFDDFFRAVFLHQESIRGLLVEEPRARNEALDRLFGLDRLRDILAGIQLRPVSEAIESIGAKQRRVFDKVSGAAVQVESQRARHVQEARSLGLIESDLTRDSGRAAAASLITTLNQFCSANGLEAPRMDEPVSVDEVERVVRKTKDVIRTFRLEGLRHSATTNAASYLSDLLLLQKSLQSAIDAAAETNSAREAHESRYGTDGTLEARRAELEISSNEIEARIRDLDATARLLGEAAVLLRLHEHESSCPVCGQTIDRSALLASLDVRSASAGAAEHKLLLAALAEAEKGLADIDRSKRERIEIRRQAEQREYSLSGALSDARKALPALPEPENALAYVNEEIKSTRDRLSRAKTPEAAWERSLDDIDQLAERLRAIHKVVKDDEELAAIASRTPADDADGEQDVMTEELGRLGRLQDALESIAQCVQSVARLHARDAIDSSRDKTAEYYQRLAGQSYFDRLRIDVQEKVLSGVAKNNYIIKAFSSQDGADTLAGSRLSTGQMNCVALSIFLGMRGVLSHNLGFTVLDDPSQNLDSSHKALLADVLRELATETQVVIATEDTEFDELLRESLDQQRCARYVLSWASRTGTSVVGSTPR